MATAFLSPIKKHRVNDLIPESFTVSGDIIATNYDNAIGEIFSKSVYRLNFFNDAIRRKFLILRDSWLQEVLFSSDPDEIVNNRYYNQVIKWGVEMLPFIIQDLKENHNHWFVALEKITGQNPVDPQHRGNIQAMAQDWIVWYYGFFEL